MRNKEWKRKSSRVTFFKGKLNSNIVRQINCLISCHNFKLFGNMCLSSFQPESSCTHDKLGHILSKVCYLFFEQFFLCVRLSTPHKSDCRYMRGSVSGKGRGVVLRIYMRGLKYFKCITVIQLCFLQDLKVSALYLLRQDKYQRVIKVGVLNRNMVLLGKALWPMICNKMIY